MLKESLAFSLCQANRDDYDLFFGGGVVAAGFSSWGSFAGVGAAVSQEDRIKQSVLRARNGPVPVKFQEFAGDVCGLL